MSWLTREVRGTVLVFSTCLLACVACDTSAGAPPPTPADASFEGVDLLSGPDIPSGPDLLSDLLSDLPSGPDLCQPATLTINPSEHPLSSHNGAYPRAATLSDGSIIVGFDSAITGGRAIRVAHSHDNGRTWNDTGIVTTDTSGNSDLANAFPLQLPGGRVLMAYRHHDLSQPLYRIEVSRSDDNGGSWSFHSSVDLLDRGIWEPFLLLAPDTSLQVYYAREKPNKEQEIVMRRSWDHGKTWSALVVVTTMPGSRDGMPAVAVLSSGVLVAVFEAFGNAVWGQFVVQFVVSADSGSTWSKREDLYVPIAAGRKAGAPYIVTLGNGQLLASFLTDEDSTNPPDWIHYTSMKVLLSAVSPAPGLITWQANPTTVVPTTNSPSWPALYPVANNDILLLYSKGGPKTKIGHVAW